MEQGLFGEVNLFADQDKENEKYINAIDAIELIKSKTGNHVPDVCRFLLLKGFCFSTSTYRKDYLGKIFTNDSRVEDIPFEDWSITSDILTKGLENFKYSGARYADIYERKDYEQYYWLKSEFFNFDAIQKLNITPDDYSDFLVWKVILWGGKQKKDTFIEEMEKLDECELPIKNKIIPLLYKKPLLTIHEAACIMMGYDPQYVEQCQNDTNFKQNFSNYLEAYDYISTCIDAQMLAYDSYSNRLDRGGFQQFLANDNNFIDGFNHELKDSELNKKEQNSDTDNSTIEQLKKENEELKRLLRVSKDENTDLAIDLKVTENTLNKVKAESEKMKAEILEKNTKIKELELSHQKEDTSLLGLIFDETAQEKYAPDLVHSIRLWEALYVDKTPSTDKHSNRSNYWIKTNTPYKNETSIEVKRLREITSPFESWHIDRKNKFNK